MRDKSFENSRMPISARPTKQNWLAWIMMGIMSGTSKTPAQSAFSGFAVFASFLWLILMVALWIRLCIVQGMLAGLASLMSLFIWTVIPFFIVNVWFIAQRSKRRRTEWVNHSDRHAEASQAAIHRTMLVNQAMERGRQRGKWIGAGLVVISCTSGIANGIIKGNTSPHRNFHQFKQSPTVNLKRNPSVDYLDITSEDFYVYKPKSYAGDTPFGLIVYMSPDDACKLPAGWADVLEKRHLLLVAPQAAGNNTYESRRDGLGIMSALAMMQEYKIDKSRVYVAGLSGGARAASMMAFYQPDLFKGTIQDCGADFYKAVAHNHTTNWTDSFGKPYGVIKDALPSDVIAAKKNVRFVLITGPGDFRRGNLTDIYENGYKPNDFQCELLDIANMGHQDCSAETLNKALDFISETKTEKSAI